ncbi:MAG: valine--tRNA ligase [Thermoplasmata archaeon]|nr:MAG: valine--tRNA ligase [Thermoplasmata archaeon]
MSESYDIKSSEEKWQKKWEKMNIYHFDKDKGNIYSIDNPPRYASGALHIGHAVHYTHIDFVARYKRMRGYNVFFPLCFDVNGIPIEERVEKKMGITRKDIDRHEFIALCRKFAEENIGEMKRQFSMLGESMDPSIYYQTDAEYYRRVTQISFIDLYEKGYIYKGEFPVNWCPRCMTAMADAEIEHANRHTKLNTVKFYFAEQQPEQIEKYHGIGKDSKGQYIEIATTRPEMFPTCQIVAVHPDDERAPWLVDKEVIVPLFGRKVKIIEDESVDPNFGTGILMICTIGDKDDLEMAFKYDLPLEICINEEGRMNSLAGKYEGMKVEEARAAVIDDMKKEGLLIKQEEIEQSVGVCWRCKTPVEFINAEQWFLKLLPFKDKVLEASKKIDWYPEYMRIRFDEWVNSLKWDWVISRQRYFATPIPLWECEDCGEVVVAKREQCYVDPTIDKPPVEKCPKCGGKLKGCEDVFDTWMDSSISPLYNTFWQRDEKMFEKMYPMSLRPQAHDIIRTWAFYTVLRCLLITGKEPFKEIMMGGFILAPDGKPMHTSLGNVIDPLEIIKEEGADPLRYYAAKCKLGEDNPFRYKDLVRGKRLMKKLWNTESFVGKAIEKAGKVDDIDKSELNIMDKWILSLYSRVVEKCTQHLENFEYSDAVREAEYFLWHEFADHYIEMVKHRIYDESDKSASYVLYTIGLGMIKLFAPFLPHITEEIFHKYYKYYEEKESIHISSWPEPIMVDNEAEERGEVIKEVISALREWKSRQGMPLNAELKNVEIVAPQEFTEEEKSIISGTMNISSIRVSKETPETIKEVVVVNPVYAKIGPEFKEESRVVLEEINKNKDKILEAFERGSNYKFIRNGKEMELRKEHVTIDKKLEGEGVDLINVGDIIISIGE